VRLIFWLSLCAAMLALGATFAVMTRAHLTKVPTEQAVRSIERALPQGEALSADRAELIARALQTIRSNDLGQLRVERELRRVGAFGFLALAAIHLAIAGFAWSWSREARASRDGVKT
jgi:hypothetical protein